ncbi:MAG: hypothetical protein RR753_06030, partial [Raoultibacter sp.]
LQAAGGKVNACAHTVATKAKPFSRQVVQSAADAAGVTSEDVAHSVAEKVVSSVSGHFKKGNK